MTRHAHPTPASETEAPFDTYLESAKEQIARTRANTDWLNGTRAHDSELVRALAVMNRDADRADRSRSAAACAVADKRINERYAAYGADLNAPARVVL